MNRKIRKLSEWMFLIAVVAILVWASGYSLEVNRPSFSCESGFYENEFYLQIDAPKGSEVYYTTDGSEPNEKSNIYDEPILITDINNSEPSCASIKDVSGFEAFGWENKIYTPSNIKRAMVISAKVKDSKGKWSGTVVNTYFVGMSKEDYNNLPIIALTIDPQDLFGQNGIYINGEKYEQLLKNYVMPQEDGLEKMTEAVRIWLNANWAQKGKEWRRNADFTVLKNDAAYSAKASVNISGGMSRIYFQKSYSISFWDLFEAPLIKGIDTYGSVKLRQGGSQNLEEFLNDYIVQKLSDTASFDVQLQQPCVVFLNGEYWGIYMICEKYTEDYFKTHYGINADNLILIKGAGRIASEVEIGEQKDAKLYNDFMSYVEETDFSKDDNYNDLISKIDINSFLQLYCTNIYFGNTDMANHNVACWTYLNEERKYAKWKWMMYDCDSTFNMDLGLSEIIELYKMDDLLFGKLMENETFKREFVIYFKELRNDKLNPNFSNIIIDETEAAILPLIGEYYNRFGPVEIANRPEKEQKEYFAKYMSKLKDFIQKRYDTGLEEVYHYFGLDVHDLEKEIVVVDFSSSGNSDYYIESGFYEPEESGRHAQNHAEIAIRLAACNGILIDFSGNELAEKTTIAFNGHTIWKSNDGNEELAGIVVPKEFIKENEKNIITISTDMEILSPKQKGISNDERMLAHYILQMKIEKIPVYDLDE